jgi:nitroreductase
LASLAAEMNRARIMAAPLTVIIAYDPGFADSLPELLPAPQAESMRKMFRDPGVAEVTAMRNGSLQGAYLIIAARALGLDCGPMSGFDNAGVDRAFFADTRIKSNFICCLGYGEPDRPRDPRLTFEEAGHFA